MKRFFLLFSAVFFIPYLAYSWDGYDYEKGAYIEIEKRQRVREGEDIEIYDYASGEYKNVEVQSVDRYGSSVEIEVYDHSTGEYRTFDME